MFYDWLVCNLDNRQNVLGEDSKPCEDLQKVIQHFFFSSESESEVAARSPEKNIKLVGLPKAYAKMSN